MTGSASSSRASTTVVALVRLRWRLLRGAIRHGGTEQVGAVVSTVAAALVGIGGGAAIAITAATSDDPASLAIIFCSVILLTVLGFGIVAGVAQPIDPRVIAVEPLGDRDRVVGLLAASAAGPPGLAALALGSCLGVGMLDGAASVPVVAAGVAAWLASLLLVARTATNLLAVMIAHFPRAGQLLVGAAGLVFYGLFQFLPAMIGGLDEPQRDTLADVLLWTPPGQLGAGIGSAGVDPAGAVVHVSLGAIWLPLLAWSFAGTTRWLAGSVRARGGLDAVDAAGSWLGAVVRRACGHGAAGAIAWRSILTRFRTPRTALETVTGAGVGLAAVIVPVALRDGAGSGAVLVGGAIQLAVLFMSGNSFGVDGPAITNELLTGAPTTEVVRGKVRSIVIVASPLCVVGPTTAALITGEWRYHLAGLGVAVGGLLAGSGAAIFQSTLVPIAVPDSDNPFAGGESGKGIVAALLLGIVLAGLAVVTVPVALALLWATDRGRVGLVTAFGALTIVVGWGVLRLGTRLAVGRLSGRDPEFVAAVTPAR